MTRGTKNAWNKTVSFVNPFDNPPKPAATSTTGANSSGWFSAKKEEKPSEPTLDSFQRLDRPKW
jgi:hypothetical protein